MDIKETTEKSPWLTKTYSGNKCMVSITLHSKLLFVDISCINFSEKPLSETTIKIQRDSIEMFYSSSYKVTEYQNKMSILNENEKIQQKGLLSFIIITVRPFDWRFDTITCTYKWT